MPGAMPCRIICRGAEIIAVEGEERLRKCPEGKVVTAASLRPQAKIVEKGKVSVTPNTY